MKKTNISPQFDISYYKRYAFEAYKSHFIPNSTRSFPPLTYESLHSMLRAGSKQKHVSFLLFERNKI